MSPFVKEEMTKLFSFVSIKVVCHIIVYIMFICYSSATIHVREMT